jgi:formylglycine-generating enzyme required for sulfatase activity
LESTIGELDMGGSLLSGYRGVAQRSVLVAGWLMLGPATLTIAQANDPRETARWQHDLVAIGRKLRIDAHEVTVGQFRAYQAATGKRTKAEQEGGGFQYLAGWQRMAGWTWRHPYGVAAADDEPAVHVTWDEARDYCGWVGLRLPTDAEWVSAAYTEQRPVPPAPFAQGRTYPFPTGESADGANQIASPARLQRYPAPADAIGQGRGHVRVGATPPGVNGLHDMGANVWEWVDHEVDGKKRTRGGSWWYGPAQMKADALYEKPRDFPAVYIGFRCAVDG